MATEITHTQQQMDTQAAIIQRIFNLPDVSHVTRDWTIERTSSGKGLLRVELVAEIDIATVNLLINGAA